MMNERTLPDEFDTMVRRALDDVAAATYPDAGLADTLVANARSGRPVVASLAARKQRKRWALPLLAVASVAALAVGLVVVAKLTAGHHSAPAVRHHNHSTPKPAPRSPALAHFHATDVSFSDSAHGWALGDGQCPASRLANCAALLSTSNGGTTWEVRSLPKELVSTFDYGSCNSIPIHGPCVDHVVFANNSDGYLWSLRAIYRTTDGGSTWARDVARGQRLHGAAQMIVARNRVVRTAPFSACQSGCADAVQTAPVGTFDWHSTTVTRSPYTPALLSVVGTTVYLSAGRTQSAASPGIFRSSDGGQTWTPVARDACGRAPQPVYDPFSYGIAAEDGALVVDCRTAPGGLRTAAPGTHSFSALRPYPHNDFYQIIGAQSAQRILIVRPGHSYDPVKLRMRTLFCVTTDGGRTWRQTATIPPGGGSLPFYADGRVYATGASDLYVSSDGGITWRRVPFDS